MRYKYKVTRNSKVTIKISTNSIVLQSQQIFKGLMQVKINMHYLNSLLDKLCADCNKN